jgi:hypothetical protein
MIVHEVFAQIANNEVKNIIVCEDYGFANYVTQATYGENAFAVDCLQYACTIGDKYHDGNFWRVDEETNEEIMIEYIPTEKEEIQILKNETAETSEENTTLQLALVEQYEENLALQEELTNTQMAIAEIYETIGD